MSINFTPEIKSYFEQIKDFSENLSVLEKVGLGLAGVVASLVSVLAVPIFLAIDHHQTRSKRLSNPVIINSIFEKYKNESPDYDPEDLQVNNAAYRHLITYVRERASSTPSPTSSSPEDSPINLRKLALQSSF